MATVLVVIAPFADYARGDRITDPAIISKILAEHPQRVVQTTMTESKPAQK